MKTLGLFLFLAAYGLVYWGAGMVNHAHPQPMMYVFFKLPPSTYPELG